MNNKIEAYSDMLFECAKEVFKIVKSPDMTEENKMLIASVNTLTNTTKTALQNEIFKYRLDNSNGTTRKLIEKVNE